MFDSVRTRLTLWYIGVLALASALFSVGVYSLLGQTLRQRLDEGLRASIKAAAASLTHEIDEGETTQQAVQSTVQDLFIPHQALAVFDAEGRLLDERHANDQAQARLPKLSLIPADQPFLFTIAAANGLQRVAAQRLRIPPNGTVYLVASSQSFKTVTEALDKLRQVFFITVPLALLLVGVGGWLLARKSLVPVMAMSESARRFRFCAQRRR